MSISIELFYHYPWLPSLKDVYSDFASKPPLEFISEVFEGEHCEIIYERLYNLFIAAFQNLEEITAYEIDRLNISLYLILKILLYILDDKIINNRIANLYSKINYREFIKEIDNKNYFNIYNICEDLNLDIKYSKTPWEFGKKVFKDQQETLATKFKIHYIDYLKLAVKLRDDYRKLINNSLSNGYIFVKERQLARLLQEYVRERVLIEQEANRSALDAFKNDLLEIKRFKDLYEDILNEWAIREEKFEHIIDIDFRKIKDISNSYPPCIKEILIKAQEGQNLIHNERLFLVWFLLSLNYPEDKIVNIFSTLPDFDRKKTEYQVLYAKRKGYTPYKCSTLKSLNLCIAEKFKDELCLEGYGSSDPNKRKKLAHPLAYVRIKEYRASKYKNNSYN